MCGNALTDVIHAVINGNDGCVFGFGNAKIGKLESYTEQLINESCPKKDYEMKFGLHTAGKKGY